MDEQVSFLENRQEPDWNSKKKLYGTEIRHCLYIHYNLVSLEKYLFIPSL